MRTIPVQPFVTGFRFRPTPEVTKLLKLKLVFNTVVIFTARCHCEIPEEDSCENVTTNVLQKNVADYHKQNNKPSGIVMTVMKELLHSLSNG